MLDRWPRHLLAGLALAAAVVGVSGAPAAADAPRPTNFQSEVVKVTPPTKAIEVRVVGGDGFLFLAVEKGHTAGVPGYGGEPYLRFRADGTVEENQASAATYLNRSRNPTAVTPTFDPKATPVWKTVATDGRWAWHDHRIHHMGGPVPSDAKTAGGHQWEVPLVVDGRDVVVTGRYRLLDPESAWPWLLVAAVAAGLVVVASRRISPVTAAGVALVAAGVAGVVVGVAQRSASPPGAPASPLVVALPALALIAGVIVVMQRGRVLRATVALAGAAAAVGWAIVRLPVLWKAVVPTDLSGPTDRGLTALVLGAAAGAAIVVVRSGALAPPPREPVAAAEIDSED